MSVSPNVMPRRGRCVRTPRARNHSSHGCNGVWSSRDFARAASVFGGRPSLKWGLQTGNTFLCQLLGVEARPLATAISDRQIDIAGGEVGERLTGPDVDVDVGVPAIEMGKARDEPVCREGWEHADRECSMRLRAQRRHPAGNAIERVAHGDGEILAPLCKCHAAAAAMEQRDAEILLQRFHLMADGAVGDVKFVGGTAEVGVARGGLEAAQRLE
jgi:hypothetical protein